MRSTAKLLREPSSWVRRSYEANLHDGKTVGLGRGRVLGVVEGLDGFGVVATQLLG